MTFASLGRGHLDVLMDTVGQPEIGRASLMGTSTYTVIGMTCAHCVHSVTEEVGQVPGVSDVQVDLAGGGLTVSSGAVVDDAAVRAAVEEAGYTVAAPVNDVAARGLQVVEADGQRSACDCGCS